MYEVVFYVSHTVFYFDSNIYTKDTYFVKQQIHFKLFAYLILCYCGIMYLLLFQIWVISGLDTYLHLHDTFLISCIYCYLFKLYMYLLFLSFSEITILKIHISKLKDTYSV